MSLKKPPNDGENGKTKPPSQTIWSKIGFTLFGLASLILFTLFKLPEDCIQKWTENRLTQELSRYRIYYHAENIRFSLLFGPSVILENVSFSRSPTIMKMGLSPASEKKTTHFDEIKLSPKLFSLLFGKTGGSFSFKKEHGVIQGQCTFKKSFLTFSSKIKKFDLEKSGLIPLFLNTSVSGILEGSSSFSGDLFLPNTWEAEAKISLQNLSLDTQSILGFSIPKISLSNIKVALEAEKGKALIQECKIGKRGSTDDLQGALSGTLTLEKTWDLSKINLSTQFSLSDHIKKSFVLLDTLLSSGKQADGSYAFHLTGSLLSPVPAPLSPTEPTKAPGP